MGIGDGSEHSGHDPLHQPVLYHRIAHRHLVPCRADKTRDKSCIPLILSMQQDPLKSSQQPRKSTHREGELASHCVVLVFCACILLGGVVLSPPHSGSPYLHIGHIPIPDTCSFKNLAGLPCPGCGLTRSIVAGMHGDFRASLMYHRLGLLTLAYVCLQFLYRLSAIVFPVLATRIFGSGKILNRGIVVLAMLYALNWVYTLQMWLF